MGSREEIGPFLTHYFFRSLYLSIAIIRPFDRALLIISGDIEENPGPVSFDRYKKTLTTLSPSPQHLHRPTTSWMNQLSTQLDRREAECRQMSHLLVSNSHRTTLQDIPHTNSDPLDNLNTKLQLIPTHATIPLPLSHLVDQLGPRQKAHKIAASARCRIKLNVKSPTTLIIPTVRMDQHSVVASAS